MNTDTAKVILPWVGVLERDGKGRPSVLTVPARNSFEGGKRGPARVATVRVIRDNTDTLTLDCRVAGPGDAAEPQPCRALESGFLCYHCLAALLAGAAEQGGTLAFHGGRHPPQSPGRVLRLVAAYGAGAGWAVFIPGRKSPVAPAVKAAPAVAPASPEPAQPPAVCDCGAPLAAGAACEFCPPSPAKAAPSPVRTVVRPRPVLLRGKGR